MKAALLLAKPSMSEDEESSEMDSEAFVKEYASALEDGDYEGAGQAIAAYVDACMMRKEK